MYVLIVNTGGKSFPTRKYEDNGAGPVATRNHAIDEFNLEILAIKRADVKPITDIELELLDTATGKVVAKYFVKSNLPVIDRTDGKELL